MDRDQRVDLACLGAYPGILGYLARNHPLAHDLLDGCGMVLEQLPWRPLERNPDVSFDPSDALVVYPTGNDPFSDNTIYKSTDGGAH
jgi:hypothetical protein